MAEKTDGIDRSKPILILKEIEGFDDLDAAKLDVVLTTVRDWVYYFYKRTTGTKKVSGEINVLGFRSKEFELSTSQDITLINVDEINEKPFLFLSDLTNFVEQARNKVPKKIALDDDQILKLGELDDLFQSIRVYPASKKISIKNLEDIEDFTFQERIIYRIDEITKILDLKKKAEEEKPKEEEADEEEKKSSLAAMPAGSKKEEDSESERDTEGKDLETEPALDKTPTKIADLTPEAKLYIQSLSIITINQALEKYFNAESLAKLGLPANTKITFDQLPLKIRQQLMDRSFLQVETLLLSGGKDGSFTLEKLIHDSSARINFSNQAALGLLMDVYGLNLLNSAVSEIAKNNGKEAKKTIKKNEEEELTDEKVSQRIKNDKENVLNSKKAQEILERTAENSRNDPNFASNIESALDIIHNEKQLDDRLLEELRDITGYDSQTNIRIAANTRSLIELFIQQGLPPEYLIPDPNNFDYVRFKNIFGNDIDENQFNKNKEKLANLIIFYWKRKRAIWFREVHQEFGQEKLTPEEAQRLYEKIKKNPRLAKMAQAVATDRNFLSGGRSIAEELAGIDDASAGNKAAEDFKAQQKDLIAKYMQEKLAKLKPAEQEKTLKVYFEYYMPGVAYTEYNIRIFETTILPQINPMDFYMLRGAGETMGPGALQQDDNGWLQQTFSEAGHQGSELMDMAGREALRWGISAGLAAATSGASLAVEAEWKAAKAADPTGILQAIEDEYLNKILDWLKKNWIWIALAALGAIAPLFFIPAMIAFALRNGIGGLKDFIFGANKLIGKTGEAASSLGQGATLSQNSGAGASLANQLSPAAQAAAKQISSTAMTVAGQAIVVTVSAAATFTYFYQTSLNSAFLTNFPRNETELTGNTENQKTSKYAEMTKTAMIKTGCSSPENNGTKCAEPDFPLSIEYTITIKPKEDFAIQITNIEDTIKFKQSEKGWEKAGQVPPSIPDEKFLDFDYFKKLIEEQGGLSDTPLESPNTSPTPTPPSDPDITTTPAPAEGFIVIPAGGSLTFTYTLDDLTPGYNHTAIQNTIEVDFSYQNSYLSGTDSLITGARVCLGECGGDPGCWPVTGTLTQMPFDTDYSHGPNAKNKWWHDAYDIGTGHGQELYGNPVYAPFDGQLCFVNCSNEGYGCYNVLTFDNGGQQQKLLFAHFQDPNPSISSPGSCMQVEAGFLIGLSGNRGFSSNNHLHYGASHGEAFSLLGNPGFSILETLVPADNAGNKPPKEGVGVTTCYE